MAELAFILVGALLVNNFVLAQFLGLCPFVGASGRYDSAVAMGLATTFVLTLSAVASWLIYHGLLVPLDLTYLRIIAFIVVIAAAVQLTELYLKSTSPLLHQVLGIYLPLITSNCAVLGVALLSLQQALTLGETIVFAIGAALGFSLVMVLFAAIRERIESADVPAAFRGAPLTLITAGIFSLAFMGFAGLAD
ncbi:MAG: electron transport complex subunit RsxA [Gammaproteobacteria bacterium]